MIVALGWMEMRAAAVFGIRRGMALAGVGCALLFGTQAVVRLQAQEPGVASQEGGLERARVLVQRNDYIGAEKELKVYVQADRQSADAAFLLGYVLMRLNKPKDSLAEFTRGAALRTPSAEDFKHVAEDYVLLNSYGDADQWMLRSVAMNPKDAESWYALGRIRYTEQKFQDAVECFQKSLALLPRSVKAEDNLGLAYQGLNRTDDAIKAFQQALTWQENAERKSEQPMLNLGIVYVEQGKLEEALPLLTKAAEIAPKDAKIREQLGMLYMQQNQLPEAQQQFEQAVTLAPESGAYHFLLGRVYHREGQDTKAKAEFEQAAKLNGSHATPNSY